MSIFRLGFVVVLAMLAVGGRAHAQAVNPLTYWTPGWPVGFAGDGSASAYGNFPSFDTRDSRGFGVTRTNLGNGFFVGSSRSELLGMSGVAPNAAFGNFGSLYSEGSQFGYSFKGANGLPVSISAGLETLKYNNGFGPGSPFAAFDSPSAGNLPVYLYALRDEAKQLMALLALVCRAQEGQDKRIQDFSFASSLVAPALECLRRDLIAHATIEELTETVGGLDKDLSLLLAHGTSDQSSGVEDGSNELQQLLLRADVHGTFEPKPAP